MLNNVKLRILGNKEMLGKSWNTIYFKDSSSDMNFFGTSAQKYAKTDIKVFPFCLTLIDFLIFLKIFCKGVSVETNVNLQLSSFPFNFLCLDVIFSFKVFLENLKT